MRGFKLISILITLALGLATPSLAFAATLSLSPSSGTLNNGCTYSIDILLDTGAGIQTDGTDVIIDYDQSRFTVNSITKGALYPDYPASDFQNGKISISGIASPTQPFSGSGKFATINLTIPQNAPVGAANLAFEFQPGATTDSNVVQTGTVTDVLSSAPPGNYTIAAGSGCTSLSGVPIVSKSGAIASGSATSESATAGKGGLITTLPKGGDLSTTLALTLVGTIFSLLGIAGLAIFK